MNDEGRQVEALLNDTRFRREWQRQDNLIYGGLVAGCVALVQPFLSTSSLDVPGSIAVVAFSVAIPLLAALLMINQHEAFRRRRAGLRLVEATKVIGQGAAVFGVAAAFWHILWVAGVAILASALVGATVHAASFTRLEGLDGTSTEGPAAAT